MTNKVLRKIGFGALGLCLTVLLSGCPFGAVFFPDKALESAVRAELQMPLGFLTESDLLKVREINGSNLNIQMLQGLELCRSLEILELDGNMIQSITPLAGLTNLSRLNRNWLEANAPDLVPELRGVQEEWDILKHDLITHVVEANREFFQENVAYYVAVTQTGVRR